MKRISKREPLRYPSPSFQAKWHKIVDMELNISIADDFVSEKAYQLWLNGFDVAAKEEEGKTPEQAFNEFMVTNYSAFKTPERINRALEN